MKMAWPVLLFVALGGCGALTSPFMVRLDADQQKEVDGIWNNMLTPPSRLDRDLLLDVLCEYQVLQIGVDRMHVTAEKYLTSGRVMLDADFDRGNPDADQLTILVMDGAGRTVRRERYSRAEINARLPEIGSTMMAGSGKVECTINLGAATQQAHPPTAEQEQRRLAQERRRARIEAATRPAQVK